MMEFLPRARALVCILLATPVLAIAQQPPGPKIAQAGPGDVRVIVTAAIRGPIDSVLAGADKAVGKHVLVEYGSARGGLKDLALSGQEFEVAILLPDVDAELLQKGKIVPGTYRIATVDVAVGLRGTAPAPDVSTPAALKAALLQAKSVKYAPTGAALDTVRKVLGTLGVADAIHDSSQLKDPVALAAGEFEINLYPISEIVANPALKNLGPVTKTLQVPAVIEATVGAHARDPVAARALIKYLQGPAIDAGLLASSMNKDTRVAK